LDTFLDFALVGFIAQLVDGSLGMGFGVISSAVLLAQGVPPPLVSASVNAAKMPTGGTAALSNYYHKNINWQIVAALAIFGSIGGILGAIVLSGLKGPMLQYLVNGYLILIGSLIVIRTLYNTVPKVPGANRFRAIGFVGGLIEGIGGSWGPIVNTSLLSAGVPSRYAIGADDQLFPRVLGRGHRLGRDWRDGGRLGAWRVACGVLWWLAGQARATETPDHCGGAVCDWSGDLPVVEHVRGREEDGQTHAFLTESAGLPILQGGPKSPLGQFGSTVQ
jgi:uncharacterized membrane protein YfcA